MDKPYAVFLNGRFHSEFDNEDDAVRVADRLFSEQKRSTVAVIHGDDILFELRP